MKFKQYIKNRKSKKLSWKAKGLERLIKGKAIPKYGTVITVKQLESFFKNIPKNNYSK